MNWIQFFLQFSGELKFSPFRKWLLEVSRLRVYSEYRRTFLPISTNLYQSLPISVESAKRHEIWHYADRRWHPSDRAIRALFIDFFYLISPKENSTCMNSMFEFLWRVLNTKCTSNLTRLHSSNFFGRRQDFGPVNGGPFPFPYNLFHSTFKLSIFSPPLIFLF